MAISLKDGRIRDALTSFTGTFATRSSGVHPGEVHATVRAQAFSRAGNVSCIYYNCVSDEKRVHMHEVRATVPAERSEAIARIAIDSGIAQVSVYDVFVHGPEHRKHVVSACFVCRVKAASPPRLPSATCRRAIFPRRPPGPS